MVRQDNQELLAVRVSWIHIPAGRRPYTRRETQDRNGENQSWTAAAYSEFGSTIIRLETEALHRRLLQYFDLRGRGVVT